jgi:membrane protein YdbS with pleckstrin-like domain
MKVYPLPEYDPIIRQQREAQRREAQQAQPQPRRGWELMLTVVLVIVIAAAFWTLLPGWVMVAAGVLVGGVLLVSVVLMAIAIRGAGTRRSDDNENVYRAHEKGR